MVQTRTKSRHILCSCQPSHKANLMFTLREVNLSPKARDCLDYKGRAGTLLAGRSLWNTQTFLHHPATPAPFVSLHTAGPSCAFNSAFCAPTAFTQSTPQLCVCRDARSESNMLVSLPKAPLCACARLLDSFQMS